jgi:hypothetical protein
MRRDGVPDVPDEYGIPNNNSNNNSVSSGGGWTVGTYGDS